MAISNLREKHAKTELTQGQGHYINICHIKEIGLSSICTVLEK